ncbi:MAG: 16S rRNA (cytosine(967)-C(5))-methyltransferase RsmB [Syntrophales bacterium]
MTEEIKKNLSARGIAVEILNRIELNGAYAEPLLDSCLAGNSIINRQDRGLVTELVYGVLRNRNKLDWAITGVYTGNYASMEAPLRNILRTGAYQLLATDRIPAFAAVNEAVELAGNIRGKAAGLVNAVLRNINRKKEDIVWPDLAGDVTNAISVLYSHPSWMVERWQKLYGTEETIAICRANNEIPPLTVRTNTLKISREMMILTLKNEGVAVRPAQFSPEGIIISDNFAGLRRTEAFRQGLLRVQDEASQLISHLLAPQPGERALDFCAGAGGKTLHIAALMQNSGEITAVDKNRAKLDQLVAEAKRLGVTIVRSVQGDGAKRNAAIGKIFDRVLVDAPCSGLGTLRRNPEIRWRLALNDISALQQKQADLLRNAAECVRPGGHLAYCVCTTTPEETTEIVANFLKSDNRFKLNTAPALPSELTTTDGFLRTFPHRHSLDGFFGAVFIRNT